MYENTSIFQSTCVRSANRPAIGSEEKRHKVAYVCSMNLQLTWVRANMSKNMVSTYLCVIACRKRFSFFSSRVFFMVGTINLRPVLFIVHVVFSIFTMSFRYSYIPPKKKLYSRGGYDCGIIINTDRFFFFSKPSK